MKRAIIFIFLAVASAFSGFSQNTTTMLQKIAPSLVLLKSDAKTNYGFFISKNTVLTTIGNYKNCQALMNNGKIANILGYTAVDAENDLVLLKIDYDSATPLIVAPYEPVSGQNVLITNQVVGEKQGMSPGKLKALKDYGNIKLITIISAAQYQTPGLPIMDSLGNVIGMSVSPPILDPITSFASPSEKIANLINNMGDLRDLDILASMVESKNKQSYVVVPISKTAQELFDQGIMRIKEKEYNAAIEKFTLLIRINPEDADAYAFRGQAKCYQLRFTEALEDFNKALILQPEFAEVYDMRGVCKAELGDKEGACQDWKLSYEKGYDPAFKLIEKFCELE
ncbi:MAG: hypothetical protein WCQ95_01995 [Bacteroidota bacterium]